MSTEIDSLVKVLGTMVMKPQYEYDEMNIGAKPNLVSMMQVPIISEKDRLIVEKKLMEIINKL